MQPYWKRAEWLDAEIQSLMQTSDLTAWLDEPNGCVHIMRGDYEFHSALFPFNDAIRDDLRKAAFILQNGMDADERQQIKEANEKREAYGEALEEESKQDWRDESVWEYEHRFMDRQITPMIVVPGGTE